MKPKLWLLTIFSSLLITPLPTLLPSPLTNSLGIVHAQTRGIDNRPELRGDAGVDVYAEAIRAFVTIGTPRGSGSGSIISSNGLILTNAHVVRGSKEVTVQANNGNTYGGTVVSVDEGSDLALVQLNTRDNLPTVRIGTVDNLRVGQQVFAIGTPFGFTGTLTTGIISRLAPNGDIQTDAAINQGNSGGPLLNAQGELIGVNKSIYNPNGGGNIGISFATNINVARTFLNQYARTGEGTYAALPQDSSISPSPTSPSSGNLAAGRGETNPVAPSSRSTTRRLGIGIDRQTFVINSVEPNSVAGASGLFSGDRLVAINGQRLSNVEEINQFLNSQPTVGTFTVSRSQRLVEVELDF